jgi:hypothetical protein
MQRVWYKEKIPGILVRPKGEILLVNLFCYGVWLQKFCNKSDITDRDISISPYIINERKEWFMKLNDRGNTSKN